MDPFDDEFEFKPLTEGLGFHKKADHQQPQQSREDSSRREKSASQQRRNSSLETSRHLQSDAENDLLGRSNADFNSRPSTNISDLMASLPPALDFVGEDTDRHAPIAQKNNRNGANSRPGLSAPTIAPVKQQPSRPQIFQPLSRTDNSRIDSMKSTGVKPVPAKPQASVPSHSSYSPPIRPPLPQSVNPSSQQGQSAGARSQPSSPGYRQRLEESFARAFPSIETGRVPTKVKAPRPAAQPQTAAGDLAPVTAHFGAGALDALMVTGMSTLLLVFILAITHVNLRGLLSNAETDVPTRIHLFLLVITVLQLYMLTAHSFFGTTLGEWAFELQLGTDEEQKGALYPVKAAVRTLLLTITGFVILPGLSLLMKRDLSGSACGLYLFRRS